MFTVNKYEKLKNNSMGNIMSFTVRKIVSQNAQEMPRLAELSKIYWFECMAIFF